MAEAGRTLKQLNYAWIFIYAAAHVVGGYLVLFQSTPAQDDFKQIGELLAGSAVGAVFALIVVELIGSDTKAKLVHLRLDQVLPGHRAFTVYIHEDPRIHKAALAARYGPLPSSPREQNALWYRMLQANQSNPAVAQAHALSLLFRDLTWVALLLLVLGVGTAVRAPAHLNPTVLFVAFLALEFLVLRHMAARAGVYLVKTVMAIEAAREG